MPRLLWLHWTSVRQLERDGQGGIHVIWLTRNIDRSSSGAAYRHQMLARDWELKGRSGRIARCTVGASISTNVGAPYPYKAIISYTSDVPQIHVGHYLGLHTALRQSSTEPFVASSWHSELNRLAFKMTR